MKSKYFKIRVFYLIIFLFLTGSCWKENDITLVVPKSTLLGISDLQMNSVTLNGIVDPNGLSTTVFFEYGKTRNYGDTINASPNLITGNSNTPVRATLKDKLSANTQYHYRLKTINAVGASCSNDSTFMTPGKSPSAMETYATELSVATVKLTGFVNANGFKTKTYFEYGTTSGYGNIVPSIPDTINGNTNISVSTLITGLNPNTSYHCRLKAINELGTVTGSDCIFTTLGQVPSAVTLSPSEIETDRVVFNALINPNLLETFVSFEFGLTDAYGSTINFSETPLSGNSDTIISLKITGLAKGTMYHYRVKASNQLGTVFGKDSTFSTKGQLPVTITLASSDIVSVAAVLNGMVNPNYLPTTVSFDFGLTTEYGTTYLILQNPVSGSDETKVRYKVTGLSTDTKYHYRVRATNDIGTSFGSDTFFTTMGLISDITGKKYKTVTIGHQTWMAENLRTAVLNDSTPIPEITDDLEWSNMNSPAFCWYNQVITMHGALYNWYAIQSGKLCPQGWHVPSDEEWTVLIDFIGGELNAGGKLKETGTFYWAAPNTGATNELGFSARAGGYRTKAGLYNYQQSFGNFWSSTEYDSENAWYRNLSYTNSIITRENASKNRGQSIRCIKD